jgi:urease accessory protein
MSDPLLYLLQLSSSALPVGAYSYSEGLETLVETGAIASGDSLHNWLKLELRYGTIRTEAAIMLRAKQACKEKKFLELNSWNDWLSAARETSELRQQGWQMGQSLWKLLCELEPQVKQIESYIESPYNWAISFAIAATFWKLEDEVAIKAYLHSWLSNLISAGVKLIPLGQTRGQQLLLDLSSAIVETARKVLSLQDEELISCTWGLGLASMAHETQYTRLFRS